MADSFPCIICGRRLERCSDDYEAQPHDGVMCGTSGNYGSTVYDPMDGRRILFNICDPCFVKAGARGRLFEVRDHMPIIIDGFGDVGAAEVDSEAYVAWHKGIADDSTVEVVNGETIRTRQALYLDPEEIIAWEKAHHDEILLQPYKAKYRLRIPLVGPGSMVESIEYEEVNRHLVHTVLEFISGGRVGLRKPCFICEQHERGLDICQRCEATIIDLGCGRYAQIDWWVPKDPTFNWMECDEPGGSHEPKPDPEMEKRLAEIQAEMDETSRKAGEPCGEYRLINNEWRRCTRTSKHLGTHNWFTLEKK